MKESKRNVFVRLPPVNLIVFLGNNSITFILSFSRVSMIAAVWNVAVRNKFFVLETTESLCTLRNITSRHIYDPVAQHNLRPFPGRMNSIGSIRVVSIKKLIFSLECILPVSTWDFIGLSVFILIFISTLLSLCKSLVIIFEFFIYYSVTLRSQLVYS